jgi:hypothetical protein
MVFQELRLTPWLQEAPVRLNVIAPFGAAVSNVAVE